jgi:hypothetical protein
VAVTTRRGRLEDVEWSDTLDRLTAGRLVDIGVYHVVNFVFCLRWRNRERFPTWKVDCKCGLQWPGGGLLECKCVALAWCVLMREDIRAVLPCAEQGCCAVRARPGVCGFRALSASALDVGTE